MVPPDGTGTEPTQRHGVEFYYNDHKHFTTGQLMDARNPNPNSSSPRPVKTANEARQGITGQHVNIVLVVSTGAIVIIFGLLWLFYFGR